MTRTFRLLAGLLTGLALLLAHSAPANAKTCGSFTHTYRYTVSSTGGLKCPTALRLVKSFIKNHKAWREHSTDGTTAGTYYTNRNYKGWRCGEGSGRRVVLARQALRELPEPRDR